MKLPFLLLFILYSIFVSSQQEVNRIINSPFPASNQPDTLYVINDSEFSQEELLILQTIQGLLSKEKPKIYTFFSIISL